MALLKLVDRNGAATTLAGVVILLSQAATGFATEVTFQLVPERVLENGTITADSLLTEGEILVYRRGAWSPSLRLPLNQPVELPPGEWTWIGEARGFVTPTAGLLSLSKETPGGSRIVWPVVPACRFELDPGAYQPGLSRVDVVSLERGGAYPLVPGSRNAAWVPAGSFLSYAVGSRGLLGIARPQRCTANEERGVGVPPPPGRDRQDLLVPISLPKGIGSSELTAWISDGTGSSSGTSVPTAVAASDGNTTLFFLGVPAAATHRLQLSHPLLRSVRRSLEPRAGEAHEIDGIELRRRPDLSITLDYRPRRGRTLAELRLYDCGPRATAGGLLDHRPCRELPQRLTLTPGLAEYTFHALDDGQYQVDAVFDTERLPGAGHQLRPVLEPHQEELDPIGPLPLWELEIYGQLLLEDRPVAGAVRIDPWLGAPGASRSFPTGDDGYYRLVYFGMAADPYSVRAADLPERFVERPPAERLGLFRYLVSACAGGGGCRTFHPDTTLIGEGRMDLELGSSQGIEAQVVDQRSGEPIPGAFVGFRPAAPTLRFFHGRTTFEEPDDAHPSGINTDTEGRALLHGLPLGSVRVGAVADGYRPAGIEIDVLPGEVVQATFELTPDLQAAGTHLVLPDGSPLAAAGVLIYDPDGRWDRRCSRVADTEGRVEIPARCLTDHTTVVLHPKARLEAIPAEALAAAAEVELTGAPVPPLEVRVEDSGGRPYQRLPLGLSVGDLSIGPDQFIFAIRHPGSLYPVTDTEGRVVLPGVDPESPSPPEITVPGRKTDTVRLDRQPAGEVLVITLE